MAFAHETKSFGSPVQDQTLTLIDLWLTFKPKPCVTCALLRFEGFVLPTKNQKLANHIYVMSPKNWSPSDKRPSSFARPVTDAVGPIVRAVILKQE